MKPTGVQMPTENTEREPHRVRLPGFLVEQETGLGDAVKRIAYTLGIKPCGACERRAETLNRWIRLGS